MNRRKGAKQLPECCTLDGESPVAESITSLRSDPSSMGHVESRVSESARAFSKNPAPMGIRPGRPSLSAGASWALPHSPIRCLDVSYTPRGAK
ncbi:hypothetical protein RND71_015761 [Anisodus tanguticus]|uniref:Uncharacterized protein n=1 Tax=Anisodus tanguticus TaxID=243964 RepID=A0AAE1VC41_9SOLA|nr:hypothetical protein RND71_015761 [Anisodus tanguticus]